MAIDFFFFSANLARTEVQGAYLALLYAIGRVLRAVRGLHFCVAEKKRAK
jgi:hypothetical protein